jgi:hypothetical protein
MTSTTYENQAFNIRSDSMATSQQMRMINISLVHSQNKYFKITEISKYNIRRGSRPLNWVFVLCIQGMNASPLSTG